MADSGDSRGTRTDVLPRVDRIIAAPEEVIAESLPDRAAELLELGETILENWLLAHEIVPTQDKLEGFRLLALHRQGTRGDPSFNACRETCREIVYRSNLARAESEPRDAARAIRLGAMVVRHLALFVYGKLEIAGLGEFCCSSRPLREREASPLPATTNR